MLLVALVLLAVCQLIHGAGQVANCNAKLKPTNFDSEFWPCSLTWSLVNKVNNLFVIPENAVLYEGATSNSSLSRGGYVVAHKMFTFIFDEDTRSFGRLGVNTSCIFSPSGNKTKCSERQLIEQPFSNSSGQLIDIPELEKLTNVSVLTNPHGCKAKFEILDAKRSNLTNGFVLPCLSGSSFQGKMNGTNFTLVMDIRDELKSDIEISLEEIESSSFNSTISKPVIITRRSVLSSRVTNYKFIASYLVNISRFANVSFDKKWPNELDVMLDQVSPNC